MSAPPRGRILFFLTVDWYFCHHYFDLACAIRDAGYEVTVMTSVTTHAERIRAAGLSLVPIAISRRGTHPWHELVTLLRLTRLLRRLRPDLLHNIAQKPVLYGTLAARLSGIPAVVDALAGMGYLFTADRRRAPLVRGLVAVAYRLLLARPGTRVIVQNPDDREQIRRLAGIEPVLIPGSGVDLERFRPTAPPPPPITILLASRLIWDKGIAELVAAVQLLRTQRADVRCVLVGRPDPGNPTTIDEQTLRGWQASGQIEWWGHRDDMAAVLAQAHIACLPSYREGLPRFLIEAAAAGLPLVTCDVPGCRELVEPGRNGLLVPVQDAQALAEALGRLVADPALRARFGQASRRLAEKRFGQAEIFAATLDVYEGLLAEGLLAARADAAPNQAPSRSAERCDEVAEAKGDGPAP